MGGVQRHLGGWEEAVLGGCVELEPLLLGGEGLP